MKLMPEPLIVANLLHLSYNMWGDWDRPGAGKYWATKPYLRFDESLGDHPVQHRQDLF